MTELEIIKQQTTSIVSELLETAHLSSGDLLIVGCSSSEIASFTIGSHSSEDIGRAVFEAIESILEPQGIFLAAQCCEHLNRALILESVAAKAYGYEPVNAVPMIKAGGSFATAAYTGFQHPTAVERIQAHAGIDIGDTLIGMHLKPVAIPVRTNTNTIGNAHVVCARTRPKFIGGQRACYDDVLL